MEPSFHDLAISRSLPSAYVFIYSDLSPILFFLPSLPLCFSLFNASPSFSLCLSPISLPLNRCVQLLLQASFP